MAQTLVSVVCIQSTFVMQEPLPTVQVDLSDIPGRLVDLGRPPLPTGAKALAAAAQNLQSLPPQSPKDPTVVEHGVAGDLVLGKMNRSMRKSMARTRKKRSEGSRKSVANSDLQVSCALCCTFCNSVVS